MKHSLIAAAALIALGCAPPEATMASSSGDAAVAHRRNVLARMAKLDVKSAPKNVRTACKDLRPAETEAGVKSKCVAAQMLLLQLTVAAKDWSAALPLLDEARAFGAPADVLETYESRVVPAAKRQREQEAEYKRAHRTVEQRLSEDYLPALGRVWTGERLYFHTTRGIEYYATVLGGSQHYVALDGRKVGQAVKLRFPDGHDEWKIRGVVTADGVYVKRDDPALAAENWLEYAF